MTNSEPEKLEGKTLSVYSYVVKEGKPVGPREVMRGANLSSPSLAYFHLQKLETGGLIEKNQYGEYLAREKVGIAGYIWIGRNLVPRLMCYSLFFMAILGTEVVVILSEYFVLGRTPSTDLFYLAATTGLATFLFLVEGLELRKKTILHRKKTTKFT